MNSFIFHFICIVFVLTIGVGNCSHVNDHDTKLNVPLQEVVESNFRKIISEEWDRVKNMIDTSNSKTIEHISIVTKELESFKLLYDKLKSDLAFSDQGEFDNKLLDLILDFNSILKNAYLSSESDILRFKAELNVYVESNQRYHLLYLLIEALLKDRIYSKIEWESRLNSLTILIEILNEFSPSVLDPIHVNGPDISAQDLKQALIYLVENLEFDDSIGTFNLKTFRLHVKKLKNRGSIETSVLIVFYLQQFYGSLIVDRCDRKFLVGLMSLSTFGIGFNHQKLWKMVDEAYFDCSRFLFLTKEEEKIPINEWRGLAKVRGLQTFIEIFNQLTAVNNSCDVTPEEKLKLFFTNLIITKDDNNNNESDEGHSDNESNSWNNCNCSENDVCVYDNYKRETDENHSEGLKSIEDNENLVAIKYDSSSEEDENDFYTSIILKFLGKQ